MLLFVCLFIYLFVCLCVGVCACVFVCLGHNTFCKYFFKVIIKGKKYLLDEVFMSSLIFLLFQDVLDIEIPVGIKNGQN